MFSSRSLKVLALVFRFLNILSNFFMYSVRWGSNFHSFACGYSVVLAYEEIIFFLAEWSCTFVENQLSVVCGFISGLSGLIHAEWSFVYWLMSLDCCWYWAASSVLSLMILSRFVNSAHFSSPFFFVGDVGMEYGDKYL